MSELMMVTAVAAYVGVAAFVWTRVYRWLYRSKRRDFPLLAWDEDDRVFASVWGGVVSLLWPIFGPIAGLIWLAKAAVRAGLFERLERDEPTKDAS